MPQLTIRAAAPRERAALRRLGLTTRGGALLAERDGVPLAAVALTSGAVAADAGRPAVDAVRALRRHRYGVMRQGGDVRPLRSLVPRRNLTLNGGPAEDPISGGTVSDHLDGGDIDHRHSADRSLDFVTGPDDAVVDTSDRRRSLEPVSTQPLDARR